MFPELFPIIEYGVRRVDTFIAHSFAPEDEELVRKLTAFLEKFGARCSSGRRPEAIGITEKVKTRIRECELFVALFTRKGAIRDDKSYGTQTWVIDEKGYAVAQDKKLLIFKEEMFTEIGGIHNDAEYVEFSRGNFEKSLIHAIEYILSVSKVPITSTVVNNMVNIHIRQTHTHQDLLESLLKTKQKNPDDFTLRIRISSAHLNMNNIELALKELLHAETDFPNNHDVLHHLGHIFLLKNSYDKAVSYFKLSIEHNAGNGKYFLCLGKAIFGLAKNASDKNISLDFFDEALRKFNHALKYADKSHHGDIQGMIQLTKDALKNPLPKVPVKRR